MLGKYQVNVSASHQFYYVFVCKFNPREKHCPHFCMDHEEDLLHQGLLGFLVLLWSLWASEGHLDSRHQNHLEYASSTCQGHLESRPE